MELCMKDDPTKQPVSRELEILMPVLAETMKFATQAIAQSSALAKVLIGKGVLTQPELNAAMSSTQNLRDSLMKILDEQIKKQS
jgi:hypothetical protein